LRVQKITTAVEVRLRVRNPREVEETLEFN